MADTPRLRVLRAKDLALLLGVSRVTVWRWSRGLLPKKRQIGPNTVGWLECEIESWLNARPIASSEGRRRDKGEQEVAHESGVPTTRNSSEQA